MILGYQDFADQGVVTSLSMRLVGDGYECYYDSQNV